MAKTEERIEVISKKIYYDILEYLKKPSASDFTVSLDMNKDHQLSYSFDPGFDGNYKKTLSYVSESDYIRIVNCIRTFFIFAKKTDDVYISPLFDNRKFKVEIL